MALPFSFLVALVVLTSNSLCSLGRDLPQPHGLINRRALMLLRQMRRTTPHLCLKDRNDFGFPLEAFGGNPFQKVEALSFLLEMSRQTFHLFSTEGAFAAWDKALLGQFCNGLFHRLSDLESRLSQEVEVEGTPLMNGRSILAVRRYFQRISVYLQEKKHSPCAWEIIRAEVMRALSLTATLEEQMKE